VIISLQPGMRVTPTRPLNEERVKHWKYAKECDRIYGQIIPGAEFVVREVGTVPGQMYVVLAMPGTDPERRLKVAGQEYAACFQLIAEQT
jgi:hypothetical protein